VEHYFLAPPDERWFFETGNDTGVFEYKGADGTEHLQLGKGRIDIELTMWANPDLGVMLIWSKWGGGHEQLYTSKGDLSRLREYVEGSHGTPLPVGLFIPFEKAWTAVKEFSKPMASNPRASSGSRIATCRRIRFPIRGTLKSRRAAREAREASALPTPVYGIILHHASKRAMSASK
jgi:hypothetical protein